jgi:hypothetical protein
MILQVNTFVTSLYEALMIYATVANEAITEGGDIHDGKAVIAKIWNKELKGTDESLIHTCIIGRPRI